MSRETPIDAFDEGKLELSALLTQLDQVAQNGSHAERTAILDSWHRRQLKDLQPQIAQAIAKIEQASGSFRPRTLRPEEQPTIIHDAQALNSIGKGFVLNGRFVLDELLGAGGMGMVFRAIDKRREEASDINHPYVAIKLLSEDFAQHPDALIALQREARKAQGLSHPNIVDVYDFDRDGSLIYMTMEYLVGATLDKTIKSRELKRMAVDQIIGMIQMIGAALSFAHESGIVHSDLKPANIFVLKTGRVKVIDFGLARAVARADQSVVADKTVFDAGRLRGLTPAYASIDMIEGKEPDVRDDIFALGIIAYELFAGMHPFGRVQATEARVRRLFPIRPDKMSSRRWRALQHALELEQEKRTSSVDEFVREISNPGTFSRLFGGLAQSFREAAAKAEAERQALAKAEAERRAKEEAERHAREEAERKAAAARAEANRIARAEAERRAKEEAERRVREEAERKAAAAKAEAERLAREEADRQAREDAERKAAAAKVKADRLAKAEAERRAKEEAERRAREEAERKAATAKAEADRQAREEVERRAREEQGRKAAAARAEEVRIARAEAERRAKEEAERRAWEDAERKAAAAKAEADRQAREEVERRAREQAERRAREEAERKAAGAKAEAERLAREEAERRTGEEAEHKAAAAKAEAERLAKAEANRQAREEAERRAREQAERRARAEADRRAKEEAERRAREEAERRAAAAKAEAEHLAREEAERRAREETERKAAAAKAEAERRARRAKEEADRRAKAEAKRIAAAAALQARRASAPASARTRVLVALAGATLVTAVAIYFSGIELQTSVEAPADAPVPPTFDMAEFLTTRQAMANADLEPLKTRLLPQLAGDAEAEAGRLKLLLQRDAQDIAKRFSLTTVIVPPAPVEVPPVPPSTPPPLSPAPQSPPVVQRPPTPPIAVPPPIAEPPIVSTPSVPPPFVQQLPPVFQPPPTEVHPVVTLAAVQGNWCNRETRTGSVAGIFVDASIWAFRFADGINQSAPVTSHEALQDKVVFHLRIGGQAILYEIGYFSAGQALQIRSRPEATTQYTNLPFTKC